MIQPLHRVAPVCFDDAREMADRFISGQPVLVNVAGLGHETARRIIDFGSGITYGRGGELRRVDPNTYVLLPPDAEFDPPQNPQNPDGSPLGPGGRPPAASGAAALPVEDWFFTDAVSTKTVG